MTTRRQLPKRDSTIVLHLTMSAADARLLRDELAGQLAEMRFHADMDGSFDKAVSALYTDFGGWIESRQREAYQKKLDPVLEKTVSALRVALGLKPEIPDLSGLPLCCVEVEREGTREEYVAYLELKKKGLLGELKGRDPDAVCAKCARTLAASYDNGSWRYDGKVYTTFEALCAGLLDDFRET